MLKKYSWVLLALIILGAFLVRLYRFNNPIADWHSWRQSDTSAVSIFLIQDHFNVVHPRFYDISNIPSGKNNPHGYRYVEFPIFNVLQAGSYQLFGHLTIEEWGRLVTILGSLVSIYFLYKLAKKHLNQTAAYATAFFFAFLPFSIYYGRTILPDQLMVTATLGGIYFFDVWNGESERRKTKNGKEEMLPGLTYYFLSLLFTAAALLLKPYAIFFLIPIGYVAYQKFGWKMVLRWELWVFGILSIAPLAAWRLWIRNYPEGIPASNWLFNEGNVRFKPFWFRWIVYERLTKLILGFGGILLLIPGIIKQKKETDYWFVWSFILGSILYVFIIAVASQHANPEYQMAA
jgi:4-amino-4-deoxy-L-arabinose transferase-like glycosyltransferase